MDISNIHEWIDLKFEEIAEKLPHLAHEDAASFACGYNMGYKRAVLDLDDFICDGEQDDQGIQGRNKGKK